MNKSIEIMSPVGSFESLMAAIQGGANSVYFGVGILNMRARSSGNFTPADLPEIVKTCKENNVKSYLTLNTIIYDNELKLMRSIVDDAKTHNVSAIIASDFSVLEYAKRQNIEVHISTQCNITNIEAVRFYSRYADVMVLARELNLNQIEKIIQAIKSENITGPSGNLIQIEVFVHGALCMAVSGKCYLSINNFNTSANRGACMQPCRRKYSVKDTDNQIELEIDNEYIMSPKDLMTIQILNKLLEIGVTVLKIEGRGRSAEYVKTVTQTYKEAINAYIVGEYTQEKINNWISKLDTVYNRGFWGGYYLGEKTGEWSSQYGSQAKQKKVFIGKVVNYFSNISVAEIKVQSGLLNIDDNIIIIGPTTGVYEGKVKEIRVNFEKQQCANKGENCSLPVDEPVRRGDSVFLIVDTNHHLYNLQTEQV